MLNPFWCASIFRAFLSVAWSLNCTLWDMVTYNCSISFKVSSKGDESSLLLVILSKMPME